MKLDDIVLNKITSVITQKAGIIPRESHREGIRTYLEKRLEQIGGPSPETTYLNLILSDDSELLKLINESTVNETYFFREEKQFQFLQNSVFPQWVIKNGSMPIRMWCAACSSGEEAYSLALLAKYCKINFSVMASDIDTDVLGICSKGEYFSKSIRKTDGCAFHPLLMPFTKSDGSIVFSSDVKSSVVTKRVNLSALDELKQLGTIWGLQNIIFVRNVFIYFDRDLRAKILKVLAENCLASGGYLFVSMNEVASIDAGITPACLEKQSIGTVFYFRKK